MFRLPDIYLVKNHYAVSLTVTDTVTGDTATVSRTAAQGVADRTIIGLCMGAPGVSAITGTVYVRRMLFKPERARCDTLYVGDSITHGEGGSTGVDGFAYQAAALSNGMICGIPGELSASTVTFLRAELQAWNPKNVVVMIGTNDTVTATWQTNVTRLYDDIVAYGATPYFCTLPPEAADTNPVNVMNPFIRASGWRYVDMARALTTGADGTTRDAAKFADTVHPNATGYAAMLVRLQADAPELFDEIIT